MNNLQVNAPPGTSFRIQPDNAPPFDATVGEAAGNSFFQLRAGFTLTNLSAAIAWPKSGAGGVYNLDYATSDWQFSEADVLPPRMVYVGERPRLYHVTLNPHFESTNPDGNAHLPFMNLFQNLTNKHHSHASVIIDISPILESTLCIVTLLLVQPGDYITADVGSDNLTISRSTPS